MPSRATSPSAFRRIELRAQKIQSWMDHASITMTFDVYGHLMPSLEDDHAKLAAGGLSIVG